MEKPASLLPSTAKSIALVLPYLSQHNIDVAVKGGGHSTGAASSTDAGLAIDLANLNQVTVDPNARTVKAGGGANWGEVDEALATHGLGTVGGTVSDTGVGGLTLGGGYGWLSGLYGLTVDNLISARVVLANGQILTASKEDNPDLFWGLRGAGQNFGVTVEFEFQAFPIERIWGGMLVFPPPLLPKIVGAWNDILPGLQGRGAGSIGFARPPPAGGQVAVIVPIVFVGSEEEGTTAFKPLLDLGPLVNDVKDRPYMEANRLLAPPIGLRVSMKGTSFSFPVRPEFAQQLLESFTAFTETTTDAAGSLILLELFDPKIVCERASNTDTAFANRGNHLNAMVGPFWTDPANDAVCRQWARDMTAIFNEELEASRKKGETDAGRDAVMLYGNYDHYDKKGSDIFGVNYPKLAELKRKYDPGRSCTTL